MHKNSLSKSDYANNYDHFSYNERTKRIVKSWNRVDAVHAKGDDGKQEEERFEQYYNKVSDHVPIVVELSFR